jgi:hypothetical protein
MKISEDITEAAYPVRSGRSIGRSRLPFSQLTDATGAATCTPRSTQLLGLTVRLPHAGYREFVSEMA